MRSSLTTEDWDNDGGGGGGGGVNCSRDLDIEDHFEPSLFAESDTPPPQWPDDLHAVFLATNLLMLYLNLARLQSSMPINDTHPLPVTAAAAYRDDHDDNADNE